MTADHYRRNTPMLAALLVPAAAYLAWQLLDPAFSVGAAVDGSVGVLLGLYICSRPAANGIDLIFFERGGLRRAISGWSGIEWLLVNALVMFIGWLVIVVGAARFAAP